MGKNKTPTLTADEIALGKLLRADPLEFCKVACQFTPHRVQVEVLTSPLEYQRSLLPWGRQFGKTKILSVYIAWKIFAERNYSAFLFAPSGEQSRILFDYVAETYAQSEYLQRYAPAQIRGNVLTVGGPQWGSKVEYIKTGLTGEHARGRSVKGKGIIVFDELSSFLYPQEVTQVIEPFLASQGGGEVFLSSPGEVGSFMHELYLDFKGQERLAIEAGRKPRHRVYECTWRDTDHLSPEWVAEQKRTLCKQDREWFYLREYEGKWTKTEGAFFSRDHITACQVTEPLPTGGKGDTWIYSLDPGLDKSPAVLLIARYNAVKRRLEVVECISLVRKSNKYVHEDGGHEKVDGYPDLLDLILDLRKTRPIHRLYEDFGIEKTIGELLQNTFHVNVIDCRIGGYNAKLTALQDLQRSLSAQRIVWEDHRITRQLLEFSAPVNKQSGKYMFPDSNDDIVVALFQLNRYLGDRVESPYLVESGSRAIW